MNIKKSIDETARTLEKVDTIAIDQAVAALLAAKINGAQVLLMGNGGSHSNAEHLANDLMKACGIHAVCVSGMTPVVSAYRNDDGEGAMFLEPIKTMIGDNDVLIGLSCSGQSENVVRAFSFQYEAEGIIKILLTGNGLGYCEGLSDIVIRADHDDIRVQESVHSAICHLLIDGIIEKENELH